MAMRSMFDFKKSQTLNWMKIQLQGHVNLSYFKLYKISSKMKRYRVPY